VHKTAKRPNLELKNWPKQRLRFSSVSLAYFDLATNRITNPDLKSVFRINPMVITIEKHYNYLQRILKQKYSYENAKLGCLG
jgi:hypothetical protein